MILSIVIAIIVFIALLILFWALAKVLKVFGEIGKVVMCLGVVGFWVFLLVLNSQVNGPLFENQGAWGNPAWFDIFPILIGSLFYWGIMFYPLSFGLSKMVKADKNEQK